MHKYRNCFKLNPLAGGVDCMSSAPAIRKSFAYFRLTYLSLAVDYGAGDLSRGIYTSLVVKIQPSFYNGYREHEDKVRKQIHSRSWQRMLVTRPPITAVRSYSHIIIEDDLGAVCTVRNPKGITFCDLEKARWKLHTGAGLENAGPAGSDSSIALATHDPWFNFVRSADRMRQRTTECNTWPRRKTLK